MNHIYPLYFTIPTEAQQNFRFYALLNSQDLHIYISCHVSIPQAFYQHQYLLCVLLAANTENGVPFLLYLSLTS